MYLDKMQGISFINSESLIQIDSIMFEIFILLCLRLNYLI
jgi:hypothetical protein